MSVFSQLMDAMRVNTDPEDEEFDDYDDDYEAPKKSIFNKNKAQEDDYIEDEPKKGFFSFSSAPKEAPIPIRRQMEVSMIKPVNVEDARSIVNNLLQGKAVVLNMEGLDTALAQRIIDFVSGATYSMDGKLQKISSYIFIATPSQIDLSGDFQDFLNSGQYDISGATMRF